MYLCSLCIIKVGNLGWNLSVDQPQNFYVFFFFVLGIENLPYELQRNFTLMRELDQRTQGWGVFLIFSCIYYDQKSLTWKITLTGIMFRPANSEFRWRLSRFCHLFTESLLYFAVALLIHDTDLCTSKAELLGPILSYPNSLPHWFFFPVLCQETWNAEFMVSFWF